MRANPVILFLLMSGCTALGYGELMSPQDVCTDNEQGAICPESCPISECDPACRDDASWTAYLLHPNLRHHHYKRFEDNLITRTKARCRARTDLSKFACGEKYSCDYRDGYEQAYVDVSQGARGDVPALPPAHYWKSCARSPDGHQCAQDWFAGYAAGAVRAKAIYEPYNKVAFSQFDPTGWPDEQYGDLQNTRGQWSE